jgi:hypothetical protein
MSVTQVPLRPVAKGTLIKLWLAIAAPLFVFGGRTGRRAAATDPVRALRAD